jgi:MFS family permease
MMSHMRLLALFADYPRAFWFLLIGMLVNGVATFVLPFEAIYLVAARHLSVSQASAIVGVYGIGSCLSALGGGLLADKIGRRPTILIGLVCLAITTFGLAAVTAPWLITTLTFSMGFWISWYRPASSAAVSDLVPLEAQARANGLIYWAYNVGMAISPLLASLIVQRIGYVMLFCIDGLGTVVFCALVAVGLPETRPVLATLKRQEQHTHPSWTRSVWRDAPFLCFVALSFVLTSIYFQNSSTLPADMQLHGLGAARYAVAIAVNGIVVVLFGLPLSHLLSRWAPLQSMAASALFIGVGFGLTALADSLAALPFYMSSIVIWTIGEIIFVPVSATVVAVFAPVSRRGIYQGIARMSWGLSACTGPLVGGFLLQGWGASFWIGCAILGTLAAGGFLLIGRLSMRSQAREEGQLFSPEAEGMSNLAQRTSSAPAQETLEEGQYLKDGQAYVQTAAFPSSWRERGKRSLRKFIGLGMSEESERLPRAGAWENQSIHCPLLTRTQRLSPSPEMEVYLAKCLAATPNSFNMVSQEKRRAGAHCHSCPGWKCASINLERPFRAPLVNRKDRGVTTC